MAINKGVAPYPSCLYPGSFARASTKENDFTWNSIIIIIISIMIIIIIDHVPLLTCWECMLLSFFKF